MYEHMLVCLPLDPKLTRKQDNFEDKNYISHFLYEKDRIK